MEVSITRYKEDSLLCPHFIIPILPLIILKINYFINNLFLIVILKIFFVLNYYFKNFFCTYLIFLILHLTTILNFVIDLNFNFLKIKKYY